ncbi:cytochrome c oxidase biogenesis protein Cmc1 like-domain-containing protein [Aspergillus filifer]
MHSHLHTPYNVNCEEIMTALDECHARGFLHKALGNCNDIKRDVNKCLAGERYERAKRNRDDAREKRRGPLLQGLGLRWRPGVLLVLMLVLVLRRRNRVVVSGELLAV